MLIVRWTDLALRGVTNWVDVFVLSVKFSAAFETNTGIHDESCPNTFVFLLTKPGRLPNPSMYLVHGRIGKASLGDARAWETTFVSHPQRRAGGSPTQGEIPGETKDPKSKTPKQQSKSKDPKSKTPNERSQATEPETEIPSQRS